jgi:zinc/manganese transport system permease protein
MIEFLLPPFAMCVILAGIHVYMGMHVLKREVIFVDLALAQMAALGATVAQTLRGHVGGHGHAHVNLDADLLVSFAFAVFGAAIFALAGRLKHLVSQEAIVGIVYAVAAAVMMLVLSRAPDGGEDVKRMFAGVLLLTEWHDALHSALVYAGISLLLYAGRAKFHALTWNPEAAEKELRFPGWWDFGFYTLFAAVLTVSIQSAGVLLVFSFLIVPAVITQLFWTDLVVRLALGWVFAVVASGLGLWVSWTADLPAAPTIITVFGAAVAVAITLHRLRKG